ncbi:hypothetical protein FPQ18DRAFT_260087 [Pyronema domesticum]|nr:hypothetical protein FPQ18DRAFT_260087 [Pyronema domesticum]
MFYELMIKRGYTNLPESAQRQLMAKPISGKWTMIYQDKLTDWQAEQKRKQAALSSGKDLDEDSPQWYVKKIMEGNITAKQLGSLSVSLRTQPIGWVKDFIEAQGQIALTTVLRSINNHGGKNNTGTDAMLDREYDIVKCLKALMNNKYGADDALKHQHCVNALVASLTSPRVTTRKLVSEVLTFLCHWERPHGHTKVLAAMDQVKGYQGETGRFDSWLRIVEVTIDGRGKLGSLVGASEEVRSGGIGMESLLMEYALATLFLINIIASGAEDIHARIHIRAQFKGCGFGRIATKMQGFQYDLIDKQIQKYEEDAAVDYDELLERDGASMLDDIEGDPKDFNDPAAIVDAIMSKIRDSSTQDYFVSSLQHLLLMRDNSSEERLRLFQLVDAILGYVAMDRRLPDMDLKASLNFSVQSLMDKLNTDAEARHALAEAAESRQIAEAAIAERDAMKDQIDLGADGLVAKLKRQLEEQAQVIEIQRRQNDRLKAELEEIKIAHATQMQKSELETRELYLMLREAQDAADQAAVERARQAKKEGRVINEAEEMAKMNGILDRQRLMEKIEKQLERKKTEFKLEGKVWQHIEPSEQLRETRRKMDLLLAEAQQLQKENEIDGDISQVNFSSRKKDRKRKSNKDHSSSESDDEVTYGEDEKVEVVTTPRKIFQYTNVFAELTEVTARKKQKDTANGGADDDEDDEDKSGEEKVKTIEGEPGSAIPDKASIPGGVPGMGMGGPPPPPPPPGMGMGGPPPPPGMPPATVPYYTPGAPVAGTIGTLYTGVRPRKKLKPMHWEKLDGVEYTLWAGRGNKDDMFAELSQKGILEEMERLFFFKETKLLKKKEGSGEKKKEFLDSGLVKAFQIALSKYAAIPPMQLVSKILNCDKDMLDNSAIMDFLLRDELSVISDNLTKNLTPYAVDWTEPGADGKKRDADPEELRREDLIYLETAFNLHHYWKSRVRALALTRSLDPDYTDIQGKLNQVVRVSDTVRNCKAFQDVLQLILNMGNYMNDTSKQVTGFKLGTLTRLVNVKDDKNQRTFMDYVEMTVRRKFPDLEGFVDELHECLQLEKADVDHFAQQAQKFIGNVHAVQSSVDMGNLSEPKKFHPNDRVLQIVLPVLPEARKKAEYLKDYLDAMNKTYADLLTYYGEDPNDENSRKRFFKLISDFVKNYKASHSKNLELEDEEKRREKRQQIAAQTQAKQAARNNPLAATDTQGTGAMDALLNKLRAAGPTSRDKREARRRARLRQNGAVRAASITTDPQVGADGDNDSNAEGDGEGDDEAEKKSDEESPAKATSTEPQAPMSPDIKVTSADALGAAGDDLMKTVRDKLEALRGGGDAAPAPERGIRDKRKERRRRNGSNVSASSQGSPGLAPLGSPAEVEEVARAKNALLAMRRGSETGRRGTTPTKSEDVDTPTLAPETIVSPPSPDRNNKTPTETPAPASDDATKDS